jgi:glucose/arabinose dehydrogenase
VTPALLRAAAATLLATCSLAVPQASAATAETPEVALVKVARAISPTSLSWAPGFRQQVLVTERRGRIKVIRKGNLVKRPFLDIRSLVSSTWIEEGLLGLAFPPDHRRSGLFYVNYTDRRGDIRIDRFRRDPRDPLRALPASRKTILTIPQVAVGGGHNGGQMRFLGRDLFISVGDGNNPGDALNLAQDLESLRGKLLRIDPRPDPATGLPYSIPPSNPFVGIPGRDEIYSYGLRNPHSFSFDDSHGGPPQLVLSDVGQHRFEEINYLALADARGANFGWKAYEGLTPYDCDPADCPFGGPSTIVEPVTWPQLVYPREQGCAVIAGPVINNPAFPALVGGLVFGDFCVNDLRTASTRTSPGTLGEAESLGVHLPPGAGGFPALNAIGEDAWGRIYFLTNRHLVMRLVPRR